MHAKEQKQKCGQGPDCEESEDRLQYHDAFLTTPTQAAATYHQIRFLYSHSTDGPVTVQACIGRQHVDPEEKTKVEFLTNHGDLEIQFSESKQPSNFEISNLINEVSKTNVRLHVIFFLHEHYEDEWSEGKESDEW